MIASLTRSKEAEVILKIKNKKGMSHIHNKGRLKKQTFALEGLAAVVNRVTCSAPVPGSTLYVHACHLRGALPAPGLAGCSVGHGE